MATSDQILEKQNEAVDKLEEATEEILALADVVKSAPGIASEAKTESATAFTKATQALAAANAALPLAGGTMTGPVSNLKIGGSLSANLLDASAISAQYLKSYALHRMTTNMEFHVNAITGSDTADLFQGRGLTEDMPFKNLSACLSYIATNYASGNWSPIIILHSDIEYYGTIWQANFTRVLIKSDDTRRAITIPLGKQISVHNGTVYFTGLAIHGENAANAFVANGQQGSAVVQLSNLIFSGTFTNNVVQADVRGLIYSLGNLTGTPTGRRYSCIHGGQIYTDGRGANDIPGSEDGIVDSKSIYV